MLTRLFPREAGNDYRGYRAAIWLLVLAILLRLAMGAAALFDTQGMLQDADTIPVDTWSAPAAATVVYLTKLVGIDHLLLTLVAVVVLIRWRNLIPFAYLLLLAEQLARFAVKFTNPIPGSGATLAVDPNLIIIAALLIGLALSLSTPRGGTAALVR